MLMVPACVHAQELFSFTEPASNMPAHSTGLRLNNWIMNEGGKRVNYHLIPEVMWGVNKNLMLHAEGFASNLEGGFSLEGGAVYAKYRFFSHDKVYRHFRMAAFGRAATNNGVVHQEEIETNGHNSGFEAGLIGTQLLHKLALSATASYEQAIKNRGNNEIPAGQDTRALNFSISAGRLILPKDYKSYQQTNLNLMVELLGQVHPESGKAYLDIAPTAQLIINSQTRIDIGYKRQLSSTMTRTAPNGMLVRVEHLLFNSI